MVALVAADDGGTAVFPPCLLNLPRQLDGPFHDLGAAAQVKKARIGYRHNLGQFRRKLLCGLVGKHDGMNVSRSLGLFGHSGDDFGTAVSHIHHQRPARTIQIPFATFVK